MDTHTPTHILRINPCFQRAADVCRFKTVHAKMSPGKQRQARKQILTDAGVLTQRVAGGQIERCTDVVRLAHNF